MSVVSTPGQRNSGCFNGSWTGKVLLLSSAKGNGVYHLEPSRGSQRLYQSWILNIFRNIEKGMCCLKSIGQPSNHLKTIPYVMVLSFACPSHTMRLKEGNIVSSSFPSKSELTVLDTVEPTDRCLFVKIKTRLHLP